MSGLIRVPCRWHNGITLLKIKRLLRISSRPISSVKALDQTRGWFYSLHAISTILFDSVAYKNVICHGLVLDAEGQKMSKSRGNTVIPWEVLDAHGADAFRWYLYTTTPPGQERRFSSDSVGEVVRNFMLMLWNTYSFFVTYARLDEWKPDPHVQPEYSDLDKWLLSSTHALTRDVTQALESYDVTGCTRPIERFVNDLSNWYLRRSRRRFWKSGSDADKLAAYHTLYQALLTVAKLLAPTMPFLSEELYQNLVCSIDDKAPLSIHLTDWPEFDPKLIDEQLNRDMALITQLASLGHAARNKANRKVRQPLALVKFAVGSTEEQSVIGRYAELLKDELNVKAIGTLMKAGEAVDYSLNPLPKQLGQKYGARFPAIRQALILLDASQAAPQLLEGKPVEVIVNGERLEILPDEVEVRVQAHEGYAVAAEGAYLAALVTDLTPDLVQEGLAREFVRRVQDLRKQAELDIADRIAVSYQASLKLAAAIKSFSVYISAETLAVELLDKLPPDGCVTMEDEFDGERVTIGLEKRLL